MKIGKIELTKEKFIIAVSAAITAIALGTYLILYAPLMGDLKRQYRECRSLEDSAFEIRNIIESAGLVYSKRVLMTEDDISQAIDELTKQGKPKGVNFISISPKEVEKEKGSLYKILPIDMAIESSYENLGTFLGSLDELEKGVVKVKSFDITADEGNPAVLTTNLAVDVYLSGREK